MNTFNTTTTTTNANKFVNASRTFFKIALCTAVFLAFVSSLNAQSNNATLVAFHKIGESQLVSNIDISKTVLATQKVQQKKAAIEIEKMNTKLYSISGQLVFETNSIETIDYSKLNIAPGMYIIEKTNGITNKREKVII